MAKTTAVCEHYMQGNEENGDPRTFAQDKITPSQRKRTMDHTLAKGLLCMGGASVFSIDELP